MRYTLAMVAFLVGCGGVDIDENVYELDIDDMEITGADPDLAPVLGLFFTSPVLMQTFESSNEGFSARMGYATEEGDAQDDCVATSELPDATLADGVFDMGPDSTTLLTTNSSFTIVDMTASGTFSEEFDAMSPLTIAGSVDLRQAVGFAGITNADDACETFEGLGLPCGPCEDNLEYCADLELTGLSTTQVDVAFTALSADEVAANCPE